MVKNLWARMTKTRKDSSVKDMAGAHGGPDPSLVRTPLSLRARGEVARGDQMGPRARAA